MEDAQIIELFFARSEDAISELDKKYGKLCHKLADNILASAQDAEECVNDAYLSTWNAIPPQRPESLPAFVGTLVRRCGARSSGSTRRAISTSRSMPAAMKPSCALWPRAWRSRRRPSIFPTTMKTRIFSPLMT